MSTQQPILIEPNSSGEYYFDETTGTYDNAPKGLKTYKAGVSNAPYEWHIGQYFFDAWLNCSQSSTLTITSHPVATGANISDHCYSEPLEFTFEIGVTNCSVLRLFDPPSKDTSQPELIEPGDNGQYYYDPATGTYDNQPPAQITRNINAYNLLTQLQAKREFIEVGTKYGVYQNFLIKNITVNDTFDTQDKMIALITLQEVITANTKTYQVSANRHATDQTNRGNVSTRPPLPSVARRYDDLKRIRANEHEIAR